MSSGVWVLFMASPQTENGYTQLANELLEQLCKPGINGSEFRVLLLVIRKTYGFKKKSDRISLTQFQNYTGMKRAQAVETIKSLRDKRILIVVDGKFVFNKNYDEWIVGKRLPPKSGEFGGRQKPTGGVGKSLPKGVGKSLPTKERKKGAQNKYSKTTVLQGEQWNILIDLFQPINPLFEELYRNTTERAALDLLAGKFGYEKLLNTIQALPEIVCLPYAPKITKPTELKRDLGKLILFMKQEEGKFTSKPNTVAF
jgi:phage replication O-like protein O